MKPNLKFLFALVVNLFFMKSVNSQMNYVYMLSQQEQTSFNTILKKCFSDTISVQDKLSFWEIVNNHGGDPTEIKEIGDISSKDIVKMSKYMSSFYEDALVSVDTKQPFKSNQRKELESEFDPKYSDLFKKNDAMMLQIASGNPVTYEGKTVFFDKELISETLLKMEETFKLFDYNLNYLETPLKTKEREYLMNSKKSYNESKFEIAKSWIDSAISLKPNNGSYYFIRSQNYIELIQPQSALDDLNKSILLDTLNCEAFNLRGLVFSELNMTSEAIKDFNTSIRLNPVNNPAYNNIGETYLISKNYSAAIESFNKAVKNRWNGKTFYNRGLAYYHLNKDYVQVIKDMDSALSLDNTIIDAYYNRGLCYSHLKNYEKALSDFNTTLKMSVNHENALINRGVVYANLKQFDNACKDFKKAHSLGNTLAKPYMDKVCN
jgi:tetratricopeptide (TPR) repeat protein